MNNFSMNGSFCGMPLIKSVSTSKTTQTENIGECECTLPQLKSANIFGKHPHNSIPEPWNQQYLPSYNPMHAYNLWQMQQSRSMNQLCLPWYSLQAFNPCFPFNLSTPSSHPSMIQLPLIMPSYTNLIRSSQENINMKNNPTLQRSKSECTTPNCPGPENKLNHLIPNNSSLEYFTVVNDDVGIKRLEKRCMKNRYNECSSSKCCSIKSESKESISDCLSGKSASSFPIKSRDLQEKPQNLPNFRSNDLQFKPCSNIRTPPMKQPDNVSSRSKYHNEEAQPVVKRYVNRNLIDSEFSGNSRCCIHGKQHSGDTCDDINTGSRHSIDEKLEITKNIHKLADLLCDFNVRDTDERNQFYSDVIKRAIDLALRDNSDSSPKKQNSRPNFQQDTSEKVEPMLKSHSHSSVYNNASYIEPKPISKPSPVAANCGETTQSQLNNRKKVKLLYESKPYRDELDSTTYQTATTMSPTHRLSQRSNSNSCFDSGNSSRDVQQPQVVPQHNERGFFVKDNGVKLEDTSIRSIFNSKSGQSICGSIKSGDNISSSSTVSTVCSCERLQVHTFPLQTVSAETFCKPPGSDNRREYSKIHHPDRDQPVKSYFNNSSTFYSNHRIGSDSDINYYKYVSDRGVKNGSSDTLSKNAKILPNYPNKPVGKFDCKNGNSSVTRDTIDSSCSNIANQSSYIRKTVPEPDYAHITKKYNNETKSEHNWYKDGNSNNKPQRKTAMNDDVSSTLSKMEESEKPLSSRQILQSYVEDQIKNAENKSNENFQNNEVKKIKFENITAHFILPNCNADGKKVENTNKGPGNISILNGNNHFTEISFSVNYDINNPECIMVDCKQNGESVQESTLDMQNCCEVENDYITTSRSQLENTVNSDFPTKENQYNSTQNVENASRSNSNRQNPQQNQPQSDSSQIGSPQDIARNALKQRSRFSQYSILNNIETLSVISEGEEDRYTNTTMRSTTTNSSNSGSLGETNFPGVRNYVQSSMIGPANVNDMCKVRQNAPINVDDSRKRVKGIPKRIAKL